MYILIGWIALEIAFGHSQGKADSSGALVTVGSTAVGAVALWLIGIGFIGLALWRLAQAVYGGPGQDGRKPAMRVLALVKTALYAFLAYTTLRFAAGSGAPKSSNRQSVDLTSTVLRYPGGQVVVVVAGLVLIGAGGYLFWQAWRKKFLRDLRTGQMTPRQVAAATWLGKLGGIARGVVFAALGVFVIVAGVTHHAGKAKGLDSALRAFAHTPLGPWLLALVAAGLVLFGVYSWFEAKWRRV